MKSHRFLPRCWWLAVLDFLMALAALPLAYAVRFSAWGRQWLTGDTIPGQTSYLIMGALSGALWCLFLYRKGEYAPLALNNPSRIDRYFTIVVCGVKTVVTLFALAAVYRDFLLSRHVHALALIFTVVLMIMLREIIRWRLRRHSRGKVLLVCRDESRDAMLKTLHTKLLGIQFLEVLVWDNDFSATVTQVKEKCANLQINTVFIQENPGELDFRNNKDNFFALVNYCESEGVGLYLIPDICTAMVRREENYSYANLALIRLRDACIHPVYAVLKRFLDCVMSLLVLIMGAPLWILIAIIIKFQDKGPVFYRQCRVGLNGEPFDMLKFRTMRENADDYIKQKIASGELDEKLVFNIRRDPRVTPFGNFLRRLSLDEIPQVLNILKGEMSWVGPRPERKELVDKYSNIQRRRLKALPGITGLQQIVARGIPSLSIRTELDLLYISKQSLMLDVYIILRTVWVVLTGAGVK